MIATTLAQVARATGGTLAGGADPHAPVTAVTTDSRTAAPGALFVAIAGARTDGHDHAAAAVAAGAPAVLAERDVDAPAVLVPGGTVAALSALAADTLARRRTDDSPFTVVGITGSSGKTSTKDLLAAVLRSAGREVVAPAGSFNNEIGLPLTALSVTERTEVLVLEMGARGRGHIAALTATARPDVGAVLNVGSAHLGEFGSREAIAAAKGELVEALAPGGTAVLFADDGAVAAMASRTRARVLTAGHGAACDVRAEDVRLDERGVASLTLLERASGQREPVTLQLVGEHHVDNALVVAACATALGLTLGEVAAGLRDARADSPHRMAVTHRPDGVSVVDDSYNANPESVRAALRALTAMRGPDKQRRTWAVLGEMLELGAGTIAAHDGVGRYAVRLDISRVLAVGAGARPLHLGAVMEGSWGEESAWVASADDALDLLAAEIQAGDVVLVKGSNATGLQGLADALVAGAAPAAPATAPPAGAPSSAPPRPVTEDAS